ncbi:MAG: tetratricopeptide repeat protein, partial [Planctomycetes bacterium]|nr:tetratricopeptide repeat protein [Planctomycetota bacterium]
NILISTDRGQEDPKIIDFGVSKAISQPLTQQTLYTDEGHWVGTPEYMSPEQALHGGQEIGNRSDIYSLGVVLYQLLSGVLPFDIQSIRAEGVDRVRQVICEEDPKTPSTKLSSLTGEQCHELAVKRGTDYKSLGRVLHGDLDWITLKALEKNPNRRYATADDLAEDLNRSLRHEPIAARPIGPIERSLRRIRRYPWATATAASILIALLMTGLLVWRHITAPAGALSLQDVTSLAVLPFSNASGNPDYDDFIEGLSINLINDLGAIPQLDVAPQSSVQQFAGLEWDLGAIKRALPVDVILRGRLTGDEDVHIELIDLQTNESAREREFPFQIEEMRTLHQEIGQWVARKLGRDPGTAVRSEEFDQRYTNNMEAYGLYHSGLRAYGKLTPESLKEAIEHFNKAIEIDEDFALAHATLANVYIFEGMDLFPPREMFGLARLHADKAVRLDATLAEAQAALAAIALFFDRDWVKAEHHLKLAQALNPKSIEIHACLMHGRDASNPKEALPYVKDLLTSYPLSFMVKAEVGCASYYAGEYAGSIEQYSNIRELNPSHYHALWGLGRAYAQLGDYTQAIDVLEQGHEKLGDWSVLIAELGYVYAMAKESEKAEAMLSLLRKQSLDSYVDPYILAMVYVGLGKHAQALSELKRAFEVNSTWLPWLRVEPKFKPLHDDPEFAELLDRVGLTGHF